MKGQTSAEFLILLSVTLTIMIIVLVVAYDQFATIQISKGNMEARNAVESLKAAAVEVYGQGEGARRLVYIKIPPDYSPETSFVSDRTISLKVRGNDVASTTDFDVYGTMPGTEGGHFLWVVSEGNRVRIGSIFLFVDKNSILVSMLQTQEKGDGFNVKNIGDKEINVTLTPSWIHDGVVNLSVSESEFTLGPDEDIDVNVTFSASTSAAGDYTGTLYIEGTDGEIEESFPLLLNAEVLIPQVLANISNISGVGIMGNIWYQAVPRGQTAERVFSICTQPNISITEIVFTGSGDSGDFFVPTTAGPIGPESCINKELQVSVPIEASLGNHTGFINSVGDGIHNDSVLLIIEVRPQDTIPPEILSMTGGPQKAFVNDFYNITVNVSDENTGYSNIKYCEIKIDENGSLLNMSPVDGQFNSINELAEIHYPPYSIAAGKHTAYARCADKGNNLGNFTPMNFTMHKEVLIVFQDSSPSADEALMIYYLTFQKSQIGLAWSYDIGIASQVNAGQVDLDSYATLLYADYDNTKGNAPTIVSFANAGKATMMFSDALKEGPRQLNLTGNAGAAENPDVADYIMNNTHYITSPFAIGDLYMYVVAVNRYSMPTDVEATGLMRDTSSAGSKLILAHNDTLRLIMNGMSTVTNLNSNGTTLMTRNIDYAINTSKPYVTD